MEVCLEIIAVPLFLSHFLQERSQDHDTASHCHPSSTQDIQTGAGGMQNMPSFNCAQRARTAIEGTPVLPTSPP